METPSEDIGSKVKEVIPKSEKLILEEEKLRIEIADLNRHWLKKPQYLQVLLPTTLAIFSLLYAITSGLFSSKQELLELNKKRLETDILAFQKQKDTLISTNAYLLRQINKYNDSLQDRNLVLKKYENSFTAERQKLQVLNEELIVLKNTKEDYNKQIAILESEYNEKKERYLKEIETKYYKEIDNEKKIKELGNIISRQKDEIAALNYNVKVIENNPFVNKEKKYDFAIWNSAKMIEYYGTRGRENQVELERLEKEMKVLERKSDSLEVKEKVRKIKS